LLLLGHILQTQIVAALTGLSIDIEAQDEIRKLAGTCGACLMDVAALLHDKHPCKLFG